MGPGLRRTRAEKERRPALALERMGRRIDQRRRPRKSRARMARRPPPAGRRRRGRTSRRRRDRRPMVGYGLDGTKPRRTHRHLRYARCTGLPTARRVRGFGSPSAATEPTRNIDALTGRARSAMPPPPRRGRSSSPARSARPFTETFGYCWRNIETKLPGLLFSPVLVRNRLGGSRTAKSDCSCGCTPPLGWSNLKKSDSPAVSVRF